MPDIDDRGKLGELANSVIQMISQPYSIDGSRAIIGTSVGIAIAPYDGIELRRAGSARTAPPRAAGAGSTASTRTTSRTARSSGAQIEEDLRDAIPPSSSSCTTSRSCGSRSHRDRVRGADALEPPRARMDQPGRVHSGGRGDQPDQRRSANGRCGGRARTRRSGPASGRGQRLGAQFAREAADGGRHCSSRPASNRRGSSWRSPKACSWATARAPRDVRAAQEDRRAARARRLRDRLFVARLSAAGAVRQDQDRPQLRRRVAERAGQYQRGDHHRDRQPRRSARRWRPSPKGSRRWTSSSTRERGPPGRRSLTSASAPGWRSGGRGQPQDQAAQERQAQRDEEDVPVQLGVKREASSPLARRRVSRPMPATAIRIPSVPARKASRTLSVRS